MAKMMMGQIDHARGRVRNIKAELLGSSPEKQRTYSVRDLVVGLRSGDVKFSGPQLQKFAQEWANQYAREVSSYNKPSFENIVLDYAFGADRAKEKARYEAEYATYSARSKLVNAEATKVEDAIVLGDQHAALAALTDFAAFTI